MREIDGVVSSRSFQLLLQWLYLGRFNLGKEAPSDRITAMIELARLADMIEIKDVDMDLQIMEYIRATVLDNPPPDDKWSRSPDTNICHMTPDHVEAASHLPQGHLVRLLLAKASIDAYLHSENFRFSNEIQEVTEFAADLLQELRVALKSVELACFTKCTYNDAFSGKKLRFRQ
jgi:hypothetical protein